MNDLKVLQSESCVNRKYSSYLVLIQKKTYKTKTMQLSRLAFKICLLSFFFACQQSPQQQEESPTKEPAATSLLGEALYSPEPSEALLEKFNMHKANYEAAPGDVDKLIWYGRFTAYKGDYKGAIDIYGKGIEQFPDDARLYRHRGHRYITIREFEKAIADFEQAATLIDGKENEMEPDGMPNAQNIPVSSLHGNIWYHLGLAYYLKQDFPNALRAYKNCLAATNNDDNVVSSTHWLYMISRRLGEEEEAQQYLEPIQKEMEVIENFSYQNACLFYKGEMSLEELQGFDAASSANDAVNYAIGNWHQYNGEIDKAKAVFRKLLDEGNWASFGYIAAEADWDSWDL